MNILQVISTPFPPAEGIAQYAYNLCKELKKRRYFVTLITRGSFIPLKKIEVNDIHVAKTFFVPLYPIHVAMHGRILEALLKCMKMQFDLVHIHSPLSPTLQLSCPIISTIHSLSHIGLGSIEKRGLLSVALRLHSGVSYRTERLLLEHSNLITTLSRSVAQQLEFYQITTQEVLVLGNGVDAKLFCPSNRSKNNEMILYVGRLSYGKGLFDLIGAAKLVCKKYPHTLFVLCGQGPLKMRLQAEVRRLRLEKNIMFLGHIEKRSRLVEVYQRATIFVFPSYYEGLPTVLLEAMACELPIVATNIAANKEIIQQNVNGLLLRPSCPEKLSNAILTLIESPDIKRRFGRNNRIKVKAEYTWEKVADRVERCYKML